MLATPVYIVGPALRRLTFHEPVPRCQKACRAIPEMTLNRAYSEAVRFDTRNAVRPPDRRDAHRTIQVYALPMAVASARLIRS